MVALIRTLNILVRQMLGDGEVGIALQKALGCGLGFFGLARLRISHRQQTLRKGQAARVILPSGRTRTLRISTAPFNTISFIYILLVYALSVTLYLVYTVSVLTMQLLLRYW